MTGISTGIFKTREALENSVRSMAEEGLSNIYIGKQVGISKATAQRIIEGKSKAKPKPKPKVVVPNNMKEFNKLWHIASPTEDD